MLYLITPTGNRFLQFGFCVEMMQDQTYDGPVTWIIVDDGEQHIETPSVKDWTIKHIKRPFSKGNTQGINMATGLKECPENGKILIIEDDDLYKSQWLSVMSDKLNVYEIAGEIRHKYYHMPTKTYRQHVNKNHAALCATGLHSLQAYHCLLNICSKRPKFIDIHLWANFKGQKHLFNGNNIVGIKGLPGKKGIGRGHSRLRDKDDEKLSVLSKWVGDKWVKKYMDILNDH